MELELPAFMRWKCRALVVIWRCQKRSPLAIHGFINKKNVPRYLVLTDPPTVKAHSRGLEVERRRWPYFVPLLISFDQDDMVAYDKGADYARVLFQQKPASTAFSMIKNCLFMLEEEI